MFVPITARAALPLLAGLTFLIQTGCDTPMLPGVLDNPGDLPAAGPALPEPADNLPPTADAGPDFTVASGATAAVYGQATDPDDNTAMLSWEWTLPPSASAKQKPRQLVTLGHTLVFQAPTGPTTLSFRFVVTDAQGASAQDECVVTVSAPGQSDPDSPSQPEPTVILSSSTGRVIEMSSTGPFYLEDFYVDFLMAGVSSSTDVVEVISGNGVTPGIYTITGVTTTDLDLANSAGDSLVSDTVYRVLRP